MTQNNDSYQGKLEKNARAFKWFILIVTAIFIISRAMYACHEMRSQPAAPLMEGQLKDTLIEGHQDVDGTVPLRIEIKPIKK